MRLRLAKLSSGRAQKGGAPGLILSPLAFLPIRPLRFLFFFFFFTSFLPLPVLLAGRLSPLSEDEGARFTLSPAPASLALLRGTTEMPSMNQGSGKSPSGVSGLMLLPSTVKKSMSPQPSHQVTSKASLKVKLAWSCRVASLNQPCPWLLLHRVLEPLACNR